MTNLQAIDLLKGLEQSLDDYCELNDEGKTAFRMAITALEVFGISEQLPSMQPDTTTDGSNVVKTGGNDEDRTSGDCISRQQAIEVLRNRWLKTRNYEGIGEDIAEECEIYLKTLPSVQPERKTGRWIESNPQNSKLCRLMTCSECGKAYIVNINVPYEDWTEAHKFCVECGTKMEGGEQE